MTDSCLVAKLSHYIDLTATERMFLTQIEGTTESYQRRQTIAGRGDELRDVFVVKSGWLVAHSSDSDGADFVTEVFPPGDIVGISQLGCPRSKVSYRAATDVELCPFPKQELATIFRRFPRLGALFFGFVALERATMIDRMRSIGRRSARDCVALFLLQIQARLKIVSSGNPEEGFSMPLSQEVMGDAVGLSVVSVNRAIRQLEAEGHLVRDGRRMHLPRRDLLAVEVDFEDSEYGLDGSWIPTPFDEAA